MTQGPAESGTSSGVSAGERDHRNCQLLHKSLKAGTGQGQALAQIDTRLMDSPQLP